MFRYFKKKYADNHSDESVSTQLRQKRFQKFVDWLNIDQNTSILDVGGTESTWTNRTFKNVTLLNLSFKEKNHQFKYIEGDACNMQSIPDKSFEVVFSNSVIEHVGNSQRQKDFAEEVQRVAQKYWVQTPYKHFPIEPHFLFPFFQYLPYKAQKYIGLRWKYSHLKKHNENILDELSRLRLVNKKEMSAFFPNAEFYYETYCGITKSIVAYKK